MNGGFLFERGKTLFDGGDISDPFTTGERSKSQEHGIWERSKNISDANFEKSQKIKKNEDFES